MNYDVRKIPCSDGKEYIIKNHYTHGCHNAPICYGLFDNNNLIGVCAFACPCSENVRKSIFGAEYKDCVTELHRLHILDITPKNAESYFIAKALSLLHRDKPNIHGVISFSDTTEGHQGTIYKASNAYFVGTTGSATFYRDSSGRLHHPRQNGVNITKEKACELGWIPEKRGAKNRYLFIIGSKSEKRIFKKKCKLISSDTSVKMKERLNER